MNHFIQISDTDPTGNVRAVLRLGSWVFHRCLMFSIVLVIGLSAQRVQAQTGAVEGIVQDEAGQVLPGINVVVQGTSLGAATGVDGRYRVTGIPAGTYILRASSIGFQAQEQSLQVVADSTVTMLFTLREITLRSSEVVVTAARREQLTNNVPVSISLVSPRDLEVRNVVSLDQALRYVPGVQLQGNQVNVRGSSGFSYNTGSRVLLLLDGVPLLTPDSDGFPFDALPFAQIARVEVLKGPGSALYGGGALGGIVNVITKEFPEHPETSIRGFSGVYEPARYPVWYQNWPDGDVYRPFLGTTLTHARRFNDRLGGWINLAYRRDDGHMNFSESRLAHAYAKIGWRPRSTLRMDVLMGVMRSERDSFLFWNGARDALNPGTVSIGNSSGPTGTNDNNTHQVTFLPTLTHLINSSLFYSVKLRLFGAFIRPLDDQGNPRDLDDGTFGFRYGGEVQLNWERRQGQYLTVGITGDALATQSSFYVSNDGDRMSSQPEAALFAQWEQTVSGNINLIAGLRYDTYSIDHEDTVSKLSPKINLSVPVTDALMFRAAFGQGFRVPSLAERFTDNQDFFPIIRNLQLRPEESTSYELGLRGGLSLADQGTAQVDMAVFWNRFENLIEPKLIPEQSAFQFVNLTEARIRGLEASVDADLWNERLMLRLAYTFLDTRDFTADTALAFRPKHLVKAGFDVQVAGPIEAGLDFRYAGKPEVVDSDFARFVPDADVLIETRVFDLRLGARWEHARVAALVRNAFEYYYLERPALLAPGRQMMLQFQVDF